jgi:hypothetical protein
VHDFGMPNRDSPTGVSYPWPLKIVLFRGLFVQWLLFIEGARSPAMTWVYAAIFWAIIVFLVIPNL